MFRLFARLGYRLVRIPRRRGDSERVYLRWGWNSPGRDLPPMLVLEVDDLDSGLHSWRVSPAQAKMLCERGLEAVAEQMCQFGDEQPRDYDVRKI